MDSSALRTLVANPHAASMLTPALARMVAGQLLTDHPDWTRAQVAQHLRAQVDGEPDESLDRFIDQVLSRWPTEQSQAPVLPDATSDFDARRLGWRSPFLWIPIAVNLLPLYGVLALGWDVFPILLLYWIENAINGLSTALRMVCVDPADPATWVGKTFMVPFFCLHYGAFVMGHAALLFGFFAPSAAAPMRGSVFSPSSRLAAVSLAVTHYHLGLTVWAIVISHGYAFFAQYVARGDYRRASLSQLMNAPYARVMLLHVVILVGGFAVQALHSPVWALVLLVALKIAMDVRGRLRARRVAST